MIGNIENVLKVSMLSSLKQQLGVKIFLQIAKFRYPRHRANYHFSLVGVFSRGSALIGSALQRNRVGWRAHET